MIFRKKSDTFSSINRSNVIEKYNYRAAHVRLVNGGDLENDF